MKTPPRLRPGPAGSRLAFALCLGLGIAACEDPMAPWVGSGEAGRIVVRLGSDIRDWAKAPFTLGTATVRRDTLHLRVTHGGGCARHRFALVAWDGFLESFPVQVQVLLAHDDRKDPCDALLTTDLRFDLLPLRDAYRKAYASMSGSIVLRLNDPSRPAGEPLARVLYEF